MRPGNTFDALKVFDEAMREGRDSLYGILCGLEKTSILPEQGKREEAVARLRTVKKRGPRIFKGYSGRKEYSRVRGLVTKLD